MIPGFFVRYRDVILMRLIVEPRQSETLGLEGFIRAKCDAAFNRRLRGTK